MANCVPPVTVRIGGANSEGKDWTVPSEVNFRMVLVRLSSALQLTRHVYSCRYVSEHSEYPCVSGVRHALKLPALLLPRT